MTNSPVPFTIHVALSQITDVGHILELLDDALSIISTNIAIKHVIVSGLESHPQDSSTAIRSRKLPKSHVGVSQRNES